MIVSIPTPRMPFVAGWLIAYAAILTSGQLQAAAERTLGDLDPAAVPADLRLPNHPPTVVGVIPWESDLGGIIEVAFSPDGRRLAAVGNMVGRRLAVWDCGTLAVLSSVEAHQMPVSRVAFTPDGKTLITTSLDKTARLWEVVDGKLTLKHTLKGHSKDVGGLGISPDGKTLVTGDMNKTVGVWDLDKDPPSRRFEVKGGHYVQDVSIARDNATLAMTNDRDVDLWKIDGEQPRKLQTFVGGHDKSVWRVKFAPDGRTLATSGNDKTVRLALVDGDKAKETAALEGHESGEIYGLAFSPDGKSLASCDMAGVVIWWDVATGKKKNSWKLPKGLLALAFAPDGRHIAVAGTNARAYILRLPE